MMISFKTELGMVVRTVALVAVDLAICHKLLNRDNFATKNLLDVMAVLPFGVIVQVACFRAWSGKGKKRVFWRGFVVLGALSLAGMLFAIWDPPHETTVLSMSGMPTTEYPGCWEARIVRTYYGYVYEKLEEWRFPGLTPVSGIPSLLTHAAIGSLPQLALACSGGILALAGHGLLERCRRKPKEPRQENP
jgi:hypothetical protein